jgi:hypothetical protein
MKINKEAKSLVNLIINVRFWPKSDKCFFTQSSLYKPETRLRWEMISKSTDPLLTGGESFARNF